MEDTYWNEKGRYQKEDKILTEKYMPSMGAFLTADKKANSNLDIATGYLAI
jgi:hypothetical protein